MTVKRWVVDHWVPMSCSGIWIHDTQYFNPRDPRVQIGTGPWPDWQDTGDPPSTEPMGPKPVPKSPTAAPAPPAQNLRCAKCHTPNEYAEPNQKDGTYVCYSCRN